ncbi:MAG: hypothetical protein BHV91_06825 [Clostridiales bacterium 44_9]|nr:MAG: hypothetical protein BHV91_06825 [Clostridiales bacterium 44_9]
MFDISKMKKYNVLAEIQLKLNRHEVWHTVLNRGSVSCYICQQKLIFLFRLVVLISSCFDQIEVRPDVIGFTEPFFRRIAGKMVLFI